MSLETRIEYIGVNYSPHDENKELSFYLHDLLSDDADWNDEYWKFELDEMDKFISMLTSYYQESPNGIKFSAIFSPDIVESVCNLTIEELICKLLNNQIGTKTEYVVTKNA